MKMILAGMMIFGSTISFAQSMETEELKKAYSCSSITSIESSIFTDGYEITEHAAKVYIYNLQLENDIKISVAQDDTPLEKLQLGEIFCYNTNEISDGALSRPLAELVLYGEKSSSDFYIK
jgi:hypothetical protein